jgi:hypothetical protein
LKDWVFAQLSEQEMTMTEISPLRRGMIDDMTIRNLSPATWAIVFACGDEVLALFQAIA